MDGAQTNVLFHLGGGGGGRLSTLDPTHSFNHPPADSEEHDVLFDLHLGAA
jgi:hypothetical protein